MKEKQDIQFTKERPQSTNAKHSKTSPKFLSEVTGDLKLKTSIEGGHA